MSGSVAVDPAEAAISHLKALADPARLQLLARVLAAPNGVQLAELGPDRPTVTAAVGVLAGSGLITRSGDRLTATLTPLADAADALVAARPVARVAADHPQLAGCIKNGRVISEPATGAARAELADLLLDALELPERIHERELTAQLGECGDDRTSLRRLLITTGRLTRDPHTGWYQRADPGAPVPGAAD